MRLLVCGGRDYADREAAFSALDRAHAKRPVSCVIQGGASGADALGKEWAMERSIWCETFKADWDAHGKAAGPKRNQRMIDEGKPDGLVAFPGGRGTEDMIRRAKAAGLKVWQPYG